MATTEQPALDQAPVDEAYEAHFRLLNQLAAAAWEIHRKENAPASEVFLKAKTTGSVLAYIETPAMKPEARIAITDLIDRAPALWMVVQSLKEPIGVYVQELADLSHRNPHDGELRAKLDYWTAIALRLEQVTR
jgi:hypothetical protein